MATPTDLAYLAGILDGEGCFYAYLINKRKNYKTGGNIDVRIAVHVCSSAMILRIQEIYDALGVSYTMVPGRMLKRSTRPAHKIYVARKADVVCLLKAVLPFLVVKRPEAMLILAWMEKWGHHMSGANQFKLTEVPSGKERVTFIESIRAAKAVA